jgi:glycosyltransferase involved in cell wall biosynthesis
MEALALARPVITTTVAGIPELVQSGLTGWLVAPGSIESLTQALSDAIAASGERLMTMGAVGAELVAREHNVVNEARKLGDLYCTYGSARCSPAAIEIAAG